jgi:hypothetical protein
VENTVVESSDGGLDWLHIVVGSPDDKITRTLILCYEVGCDVIECSWQIVAKLCGEAAVP